MRNEATACWLPWPCGLLAVLTILLAVAASPARAADIYRILGVEVDATAESAVAAREQAIAAGEREGLARLLRRLTSPADHARLPSTATLPMERLVNSYEIAQERVGPTRYIATLNVSYVAEEVQELLRGMGFSYVTRRSEPMLVVPVEETVTGPVAWLEASSWRTAWYEALEQATVTVLALPLADLSDVAMAPAAAVEAGDRQVLEALGARYGAERVVVATAGLERSETGELTRVSVTARDGESWSRPLVAQTLEAAPDEDEAALLARAAGLVVDAIEEDWKRRTLVPLDELSTLVAAVPLADLSGWVQIRNDLAGVREVRSLRVESFSRAGARVEIGYAGELVELALALERAGLALVEEDGAWHLRPATGPVGLPTPPLGLPSVQ